MLIYHWTEFVDCHIWYPAPDGIYDLQDFDWLYSYYDLKGCMTTFSDFALKIKNSNQYPAWAWRGKFLGLIVRTQERVSQRGYVCNKINMFIHKTYKEDLTVELFKEMVLE